jgi:hypothetical protein
MLKPVFNIAFPKSIVMKKQNDIIVFAVPMVSENMQSGWRKLEAVVYSIDKIL